MPSLFLWWWDKFRDEWLTSRRALSFFLLGAVFALAEAPILFGWVHPAEMSFWRRLPWEIIGLLAPLGIVGVYFGMWLYWVRLDGSSRWAKRVWFLILLLGPWYGSCLYCFFVYFPQMLRQQRTEFM